MGINIAHQVGFSRDSTDSEWSTQTWVVQMIMFKGFGMSIDQLLVVSDFD